MRVLLEGVEMTVSIAAKNFREKVRKSIMPLSVVLLVLSTVITVLLAAIVMMPDLTGNEMKSSSGILKCAALAIFAVFLSFFSFSKLRRYGSACLLSIILLTSHKEVI